MPANGNGMVYAMYGDVAYVQSIYLLSGFWKPPTGSDEALFNRQMSSVQITVECGFRDVDLDMEISRFLQCNEDI